MKITTAVAADESDAPPLKKMKTAKDDVISVTEETLIPENIILQSILPFLPIKSALRFQSVSKPWRTFIKQSFFTRLHLSISQSGNPTTFLILSRLTNLNPNHHLNSKTMIEVVTISVDKNFKTIEPSGNHYASLQAVKGDVLWNLRGYFGKVVGVCCGVFCVTYGDFVLLWNPAIREVKVVECAFARLRFILGHCEKCCVGFGAVKDGYDNVVNFKLLFMSNDYGTDTRFFSVYSLNTNAFNVVESPSFMIDRIVERAGSVYLNGVLYWLAWGSKAKESAFVLTFDIMNETLGRIELPTRPGNERKECNNFLSVFGGQYLLLAVAAKGSDGMCVDVWVLINEGNNNNKKRWMRAESSIGYVRTRGEQILGYWADGNAVISHSDKSLNFHTENKCSKFKTEFSRNMACLEYVETFVSPKRISEQDDFQDID